MDPDQLAHLPLFDRLTPETRRIVVPLLSSRYVPAGELVFDYGDPPGDLYILEEGVAEAVITVEGRELILSPLEAVTFFGGMSMIEQEPRSSAIRARTDLKLIGVPREFLGVLEEVDCPGLSRFYERFFLVTSQRLRRANQYIAEYFHDLLKKTESDQFREELQHLLVHDLRSPLAICESGLDLVINKRNSYGPLTDKQIRVLKRSRRSASFLRLLVEEILEVGRSESGEERLEDTTLEAVLLTALPQSLSGLRGPVLGDADLEDIAHLQRALERQDFHIQAEPKLLKAGLRVDRFRLIQVLMNLIGNALKHAPGWIALRLQRHEDRLRVAVVDRGPGIPDEYRDIIFDLRWQARAKSEGVRRGFGLGLAGAARLVEGLGGVIRAESGDGGVGTQIVFGMPWRPGG